MGGLKVGLQQALNSCTMDTYNEALDRALTTETNLLCVGLIRSDDKKKDLKGGEHKSGERIPKTVSSVPDVTRYTQGDNVS